MMRRVTGVCVGLLLLAVPVRAQVVEGSVSGGYTLSDGVDIDDLALLGSQFQSIEVNSGGSFNLTIGGYVTPRGIVEFMYGRQFSKMTAEGVLQKVDVSELDVDTYHVNFNYHFGGFEAPLQPFFYFGLGATHYSFGSLLVPGNPGAGNINNDTRFSTTWGLGVKYYASKNAGIRAGVRWTPTYIRNNGTTGWCDPFYGCWVGGNPDYSHQFEFSGGVVLRY